jgi:hypothetical protein
MDALIALLKSDSNAANAFGALASATVAVLALVVSVASVCIATWAVRSERRHSQLSVRPLAEVTIVDYENSLHVKLRNHGTGPMIVTAVTISDGADARPKLVDWMPTLPGNRAWTGFSDVIRDRSIRPGGEIVLLELTELEGEKGFAKCRDVARAALVPLTVNVEYTDIYDNVMKPRRKALAWFERRLAT